MKTHASQIKQSQLKRILLTSSAVVVVLAVVASLVLFAVRALAGPHSSAVPSWMQKAVFSLGWLIAVAVSALAGRHIWRRLADSDDLC